VFHSQLLSNTGINNHASTMSDIFEWWMVLVVFLSFCVFERPKIWYTYNSQELSLVFRSNLCQIRKINSNFSIFRLSTRACWFSNLHKAQIAAGAVPSEMIFKHFLGAFNCHLHVRKFDFLFQVKEFHGCFSLYFYWLLPFFRNLKWSYPFFLYTGKLC